MNQTLSMVDIFQILGSLAGILSVLLYIIIEWDKIIGKIGGDSKSNILLRAISLIGKVLLITIISSVSGALWGAFIGNKLNENYGAEPGAYIGALILGISGLLASFFWRFNKFVSIGIILGVIIKGTITAQSTVSQMFYVIALLSLFDQNILFRDVLVQVLYGSSVGALIGAFGGLLIWLFWRTFFSVYRMSNNLS